MESVEGGESESELAREAEPQSRSCRATKTKLRKKRKNNVTTSSGFLFLLAIFHFKRRLLDTIHDMTACARLGNHQTKLQPGSSILPSKLIQRSDPLFLPFLSGNPEFFSILHDVSKNSTAQEHHVLSARRVLNSNFEFV